MAWYTDLRDTRLFSLAERDWTSRRLLDLRARLKSELPHGVPRKTKDASIIIGTWNLRDFDNNKFRHGPRRRESLFYIAEILSAFDICAVQEVNEDLAPLKQVIRLMGPGWDFIATDVTVGASGNRERMAFIYNKDKVGFRNIAGEIVLPKHALLPDEQQFARTPFMVSFQAGWFKFSLCTVHIYFGEDGKDTEGYQRRVKEIEFIAREMADRAEREDENFILLGDFNIKNTVDETMQALTKAGFQLPPELFPSNILGTKYYDQIAFRTRKDEVTFLSAGAFNFTDVLFKPEHYDHYAPVLPQRHRDLDASGAPRDRGKDKDYYSKRWLTWQMSDHLPLWVELAIDFSDEHLLHNLDDTFAAGDVPAQVEHTDDQAQADSPPAPAEPIGKKRRRRKRPRVATKEKIGTLAPAPRMTLGEAWRIFRWVASGKAEAFKRRQKNQAKDKK
ncbi:endonuclease/exonuclease/phosphatase family protein [Hyphomonas sp.]|uniref:endonuclease/exonuclease/phosphatase family protein n=1 Tax=Hyphomonas sp. TaxID=87 RepID=UPI003D2996DD